MFFGPGFFLSAVLQVATGTKKMFHCYIDILVFSSKNRPIDKKSKQMIQNKARQEPGGADS